MSDVKHDKAIDLTEQALEKLTDGDEKAAEKLIAQAKKLDPAAPAEVVQDLDEDAINRRAHGIWEKAGKPHGEHDKHWEQARKELASNDNF